MCFYCRSYIVNKTFSKYNSKSTNNFSFRNELNDTICRNFSGKAVPLFHICFCLSYTPIGLTFIVSKFRNSP